MCVKWENTTVNECEMLISQCDNEAGLLDKNFLMFRTKDVAVISVSVFVGLQELELNDHLQKTRLCNLGLACKVFFPEVSYFSLLIKIIKKVAGIDHLQIQNSVH